MCQPLALARPFSGTGQVQAQPGCCWWRVPQEVRFAFGRPPEHNKSATRTEWVVLVLDASIASTSSGTPFLTTFFAASSVLPDEGQVSALLLISVIAT